MAKVLCLVLTIKSDGLPHATVSKSWIELIVRVARCSGEGALGRCYPGQCFAKIESLCDFDTIAQLRLRVNLRGYVGVLGR